jgi:hypothetical protein
MRTIYIQENNVNSYMNSHYYDIYDILNAKNVVSLTLAKINGN